jgi:hypothetical protein
MAPFRPEYVPPGQFVISVRTRHEVSDYSTWRKACDEFDATRRKLGVTVQAVYRSADNPNDIAVTHDFKTVDEAKASRRRRS